MITCTWISGAIRSADRWNPLIGGLGEARTGVQPLASPEHALKPFLSLALAAVMMTGAAHAQTVSAPDPAVFLAANAKVAGVKTLPSGLQYKIAQSGPPGPSPRPGYYIKVHYEGALTSGQVFDSSFARNRPAIMPLANLVPAWMEALPLMKVGDEWTLYVPPQLGYGASGQGPIPPNSVLVFRVKLLGMLSTD